MTFWSEMKIKLIILFPKLWKMTTKWKMFPLQVQKAASGCHSNLTWLHFCSFSGGEKPIPLSKGCVPCRGRQQTHESKECHALELAEPPELHVSPECWSHVQMTLSRPSSAGSPCLRDKAGMLHLHPSWEDGIHKQSTKKERSSISRSKVNWKSHWISFTPRNLIVFNLIYL